MATGLEIAACDVTSTAQVESDPAAAFPRRSEGGSCKHLDIAITVCKYRSHPGVPAHRRGTPSSPRTQQKCLDPLAGAEGGRTPRPTPALVGGQSHSVRPFCPRQQPLVWVGGLRSFLRCPVMPQLPELLH